MPVTREETRKALWNHIEIADSEIPRTFSTVERANFIDKIKGAFCDSLHAHARPEHTEAIVNHAYRGKYTAYITLRGTTYHLREKRAYSPNDSYYGSAGVNKSYHALNVLDKAGNLQRDAGGGISLDPYFPRRVVHETMHVLDIDHRDGQFGYSGAPAYKEARTEDRLHAKLIVKLHAALTSKPGLVSAFNIKTQKLFQGNQAASSDVMLSAAQLAQLEKEYEKLRMAHVYRMHDPDNDGVSFAVREPPPATLQEYFDKLTGKDYPYLQQLKLQTLAAKPALANEHAANIYLAMLQQQYEQAGVKEKKDFIDRLGYDINENVTLRITEFKEGYYDRSQRMQESIAKATDAIQLNIGNGARQNGRNPVAALLIPHLEQYLHRVVYPDMAAENMRAQSDPVIQRAKAALNPASGQQAAKLPAVKPLTISITLRDPVTNARNVSLTISGGTPEEQQNFIRTFIKESGLSMAEYAQGGPKLYQAIEVYAMREWDKQQKAAPNVSTSSIKITGADPHAAGTHTQKYAKNANQQLVSAAGESSKVR